MSGYVTLNDGYVSHTPSSIVPPYDVVQGQNEQQWDFLPKTPGKLQEILQENHQHIKTPLENHVR